VGDDVAVVVRGVDDLDRPFIDDEQIEVGIAGAENNLAILKRNAIRQRAKLRQIGGVEVREGDFIGSGQCLWRGFGGGHGVILFTAGLLMATSPLRAAWSSADPRTISWGRFLPPLLSLTLATAAVAFFFQYVSAFLSRHATVLDAAGSGTAETSQIIGIMSVLVTNLILMAPVLLILRRWQPPFGSVTFLFTAVGAMMASQHEFEVGVTVIAALVGGLAADVLISCYRPSPNRPGPHRVVAMAIPAVLWTTYFALLDLQFGVAWVTELWAGTIVLAVLSGLALSLLTMPPASGAEPEG